jgi:hypothetical protein
MKIIYSEFPKGVDFMMFSPAAEGMMSNRGTIHD